MFYPSIGSVVALFQVDPFNPDISEVVGVLLASPNAVPDLNISSVNINGRPYSVTRTESSTGNQNSSTGGSNVGLIVGLIVGLLGGLLLITISGIYFYKQRRASPKRRKRYANYEEPPLDIPLNAPMVRPPIWPQISLPDDKAKERIYSQ